MISKPAKQLIFDIALIRGEELFYNLDYFMTFKVKLFRISFRLDNIQSFWNKVPRMPISRYPYNDFSYRIGIGWTMTD